MQSWFTNIMGHIKLLFGVSDDKASRSMQHNDIWRMACGVVAVTFGH